MYLVVHYTVGVLAMVTMLFAASACDTEPEGDRSPPPEAETAPPQQRTPLESASRGDGAAEKATVVTVRMTDFQFELSETTFAPGTYTFVAEQAGGTPHALTIEGPGVNESTPEIPPGGKSEEVTVTLEPGTYTLLCPIGNHLEQGMEVTIRVS